jgi:hypothetical protein
MRSKVGNYDVYIYAIASDICDVIIQMCKRMELSYNCSCGHTATTSTKRADGNTWETESENIRDARLVVLCVNESEMGVGVLLGIAREYKLPAILVSKENQQTAINRLVLDHPAVEKNILYSKLGELESQLQQFLFRFFSKLNLVDAMLEDERAVTRYAGLDASLDETLVAGKFRKLPYKPISKTEWQQTAHSNSQLELFTSDHLTEPDNIDDDEEIGYPRG